MLRPTKQKIITSKIQQLTLHVSLLPLQPNAEAQFLEVKNAFTVLSDAQQRAQYDRKLKGVSSSVFSNAAAVTILNLQLQQLH